MPLMQSPYVGKPIDVPEGQVDGFLAAGFEVVAEKSEKKAAPKRRSSK